MWTALNYLYIALRARASEFVKEERGAVDIVAIVVMIGIAVLLAVLFRTQITNLLNTLFETITGKAQEAVGE